MSSPASPGVAREARIRARARSLPCFLSRRAARAPERRRGVSAIPSNVFVRFRSSPGTPREGETLNCEFLSKTSQNRKTRKNKKHENRETSVFHWRVCSFSHCAFFRFFAPPGARRAFSRRRPPFEHYHSVFLSISHVASKKRARAKREKSVTPQSFFFMKWRECSERFARFRSSASPRSRRERFERPSRFARMLCPVCRFPYV